LAAALNIEVADFFKEEPRPKVILRAPLDFDWALSAPEDEFVRKLGEAPLEELVELERAMIARFRELKAQHPLETGKPSSMVNEFFLIWGRANDVQRSILEKRAYPEQAPITPELNREFQKLLRQHIEAQA
jgi:hypothetical protein